MADYGQVGGLAYAIPQKFIEAGGSPQGEVPGPNGIANTGGAYMQPERNILAEREELTDNYFNNYAALDTYAKDMAKRGINVFEPDYSQPGGGEAFKTFQRMQANVMHGANALKNEFEAEKEMRKLMAEGKIDWRQGADRTGLAYSKGENFFSKAISPEVIQANQAINQETNTAGDEQRVNQMLRDPRLAHLIQLRKDYEQRGLPTDEIDRDINALSTNIHRQDPSVMAASIRAYGSGNKNSYDTSIFKKFYNIGAGAWAPGTYKVDTHGKHGAVWNYTDLKGDKYGTYRDETNPSKPVLREKIIKNVYATPETNQIFVSFEDPNIPDEQIKDPYHFARQVISNNEKHGDFARTMRAVYEQGMGDEESGGVNPLRVIDPNFVPYQNKMRETMGTAFEGLKSIQAKDREKLSKLEHHYFIPNDSIDFKTKDGSSITVKVQKDGNYEITNWNKFWPEGDDEANFQNLTTDQVIDKLNEAGVYQLPDSQSPTTPTPAPTPTAKPNDMQQKALAAFITKFKRQPTPSEMERLMAKYK